MPLKLRCVGAGLTVVLVLSTLLAAAPAVAAAPHTAAVRVTTKPLTAGAGWLATQFTDRTNLPHPGGNHFGATFGGTYYPDYGENADAIFGMAAAGVGGRKITTALAYLRHHVDAYADLSRQQGGPYDGSIGKLALAVIVAGGHPRHFGGYNLLAALRKDECPPASTTCTPGEPTGIFSSVSESFVVLTEARAGTGPSPDGLGYFLSLQCENGGFTSGTGACGTGDADLDATSYAIMALQAVGGQHAAIDRAVGWLRSQQKSGGYWISQKIPNVNSTGLAAAALAGVGRPVRSARAWLRSQQVAAGKRAAGAFAYKGSVAPTTTAATSPSVLATAQALTGLGTHGSLAVDAEPASVEPTAPLFPPVARTSTRARRGTDPQIKGLGFAAGERVRVTLLDGTQVGHGIAGPLGVVRTTWRVLRSLPPGRHTVVLHGLASGVAARHKVIASAAAPDALSTSATFATSGAPKPTHVGIDIQGKGVRCVAWHKGITGDEILNDVATVKYRSDGVIVQIDGAPASATADDTHYWSYWHDSGSAWKYSEVGESGFHPRAGEVEGWAYDNGAANAPKPTAKAGGLYAAICGKKDAATAPVPTHSATSTRSDHPRPNRSTPAPRTVTSPRAARASAPPGRTAEPTPTRSATGSNRTHARGVRVYRTGSHAVGASSRRPRPPAAPTTAGGSTRPLKVLAKPTAASTSTGSPVGTYVVLGLVVLLLAGGGFAAVRRRSSS